jgi:chemotaxis protein methyltransferase CheR
MPSLMMSPQLFVLFSTLVEEAAGIVYGQHDHDLFANKVADHAIEEGFSSLLDFYYRLRYDDHDGSEMKKLIEVLLVHESYFFRELPPVAGLVNDHLASICKQRGRARVWSAACSTGEEPFTLAMLLDQRGILDQVEIVATDLSAEVIARAAKGLHTRRSLRDNFPQAIASRYLDTTEKGIVVAPRIRDAVTFNTLNLVDPDAIRRLGTFDAILCRNVLIYFRDNRVASVVDHLAMALAPGGLLAVGVSESLLRFGTSLICEERGGSFFYRKAA